MASSGSIFSRTLQDITTTKLNELSKKRARFEEQRKAIRDAIQKQDDALGSIAELSAGMKNCFPVYTWMKNSLYMSTVSNTINSSEIRNAQLEIDLKNIDRFIAQARHDPSVSPRLMQEWQSTLLQHLNTHSLKFEYAALYGQLTMEWLSMNQERARSDAEDTEMSEDFEKVSEGAKLESRRKWEEAAFEAANVDLDSLSNYLLGLFSSHPDETNEVEDALKMIRENVKDFEEKMSLFEKFNLTNLRWCITGLLVSDLLTDEKRAVLKDFDGNVTVLNEIMDVLNMRIAALSSWSWGEEVQVEERRQLNGIYNIYMHEDLLQAIFLQFVGVKWSVFFKRSLSDFRRFKGVWKSPQKCIPPVDIKRRAYYLGALPHGSNIQSKKQRIYRTGYFLSQLPDTEKQSIVAKEGEEEAEIGTDDAGSAIPRKRPRRLKQTARKAVLPNGQPWLPAKQKRAVGQRDPERYQENSLADTTLYDEEYNADPNPLADATLYHEELNDEYHGTKPKNAMEAKQNLLHLLSTDILIKTRIHGEITAFRSQFESWNSSMPHATIYSILSFFGVSEKWLGFFRKFLEAPLRFSDDSVTAPRLRKRGSPGSHVLTDLFGELILFCLDYAVNKATEGEILWRVYDDFWFWSADHGICLEAWKTVGTFCKTMEVSLDSVKSGSVRIPIEQKVSAEGESHNDPEMTLPKGRIRWGMLALDPDSGRFEIDRRVVEEHIQELGRQLQSQEQSVFAWIQAWNTYATTFFTSNFGRPANCFGREHVDNMLSTLHQIQRVIFSKSDNNGLNDSGNVLDYLKRTIEQRFGVNNIPDGYFYFPIELGGLELRNPFIDLLNVRDNVIENPSHLLDEFFISERKAYAQAKKTWETRDVRKWQDQLDDPNFRPEDDTFMSFAEYTKYRETLPYGSYPGGGGDLYTVYSKLLDTPTAEEQPIETYAGGKVQKALNALPAAATTRQNVRGGIVSDWHSMDPYWKWVAQLYGPEIIDRFGGFTIVEPGLLPMGMVNLFRSGRVKWQE